MATVQQAVLEMLDRAVSDPDFAERLRSDPMTTARSEGFDLSIEDVKSALRMPDASGEEAVEALRQRLSRAAKG